MQPLARSIAAKGPWRLLVTALSLAAPAALAAQHPAADRSIAGSLLTAPPLPASPAIRWLDTARIRAAVRVEVQHSRAPAQELASPLVVVGARVDTPERDSTGWSATGAALRVGFGRRGDGGVAPLALEIQAGARSLGYVDAPGRPDLGVDILAGWSRLDRSDSDFSLGVRFPVEWVVGPNGAPVTLAFAPTVAWGDMRFRRCTDRGAGDNCGDLGIQLEAGRTRFLVSGGAGVGFPGSGLTVSLGAQRLLAAGQELRVALGVSWTR